MNESAALWRTSVDARRLQNHAGSLVFTVGLQTNVEHLINTTEILGLYASTWH